ncbi:agouti-related protein [Syngnathoides biaculeatus]|uniref:agouti-related protein n=1 Tax=Syngnathoides biaculeatus TaxID=300417 RepID=UPI002ADD9ACC|nr:agouti-related protein [Syngnathoides biaculeatus]
MSNRGAAARCWFFSLLALSSALVRHDPRDLRLDRDQSPAERSRAPEAVRDPALLPVDAVDFLMEAESYDQDGDGGRAMRSPRRCIRHQQSCLGFPLPCCDACDTCYCRFFNAICYCRRVGHACPPERT